MLGWVELGFWQFYQTFNSGTRTSLTAPNDDVRRHATLLKKRNALTNWLTMWALAKKLQPNVENVHKRTHCNDESPLFVCSLLRKTDLVAKDSQKLHQISFPIICTAQQDLHYQHFKSSAPATTQLQLGEILRPCIDSPLCPKHQMNYYIWNIGQLGLGLSWTLK